MSDNPNKIQRLQLENFTCFERADLEFSTGINVFIGENGTGKTHLLKVMYSIIGTEVIRLVANSELDFTLNNRYDPKYFGIESVFDLKRKNSLGDEAKVIITQIEQKLILEFTEEQILFTKKLSTNQDSGFYPNALFIPIQEMLSVFEGFINLYQNREIGLDKTYFDLAIALDGLKLKGQELEQAEELLQDIKIQSKIEVFKKGGKFFISQDSGRELEAPVVAQGINKLGQLYYLILNGSLTKDTILFWDEPETGLNPKYIKVVAQFLQTLANAGVQIFVATHDYLLVNLLSLMAEYPKEYQKESGKATPPMRFFGLYKGENGTEIEYGDTLGAIQNDAIQREFASYDDLAYRLSRSEIKI